MGKELLSEIDRLGGDKRTAVAVATEVHQPHTQVMDVLVKARGAKPVWHQSVTSSSQAGGNGSAAVGVLAAASTFHERVFPRTTECKEVYYI